MPKPRVRVALSPIVCDGELLFEVQPFKPLGSVAVRRRHRNQLRPLRRPAVVGRPFVRLAYSVAVMGTLSTCWLPAHIKVCRLALAKSGPPPDQRKRLVLPLPTDPYITLDYHPQTWTLRDAKATILYVHFRITAPTSSPRRSASRSVAIPTLLACRCGTNVRDPTGVPESTV